MLLLSQAVRGNYTCLANEYCKVDGACQAGDPSKCEACPNNAYSSGDGTYRTCICGPGYTPAVNILESVSEPRLRLATAAPVSSHDQIQADESICARVEVSFPVTSSRGSGHAYPEGTWGTVLDQANTFLLGTGEAAKSAAVPIICGQMGLSGGRAFVTSSFNSFHPAAGPFWIRFERNDAGTLHDSATYDHTARDLTPLTLPPGSAISDSGCFSNVSSLFDCAYFHSNTSFCGAGDVAPKDQSCRDQSDFAVLQLCCQGAIATDRLWPEPSSCEGCSLGKYKTLNGMVPCEYCPAGTYADRTGASVCTDCPTGLTSPVGSVSPSACVAYFQCDACSNPSIRLAMPAPLRADVAVVCGRLEIPVFRDGAQSYATIW